MIDPEEENPNGLDDQDDVNEIKAADAIGEPDPEAGDLGPTQGALEQSEPVEPTVDED